MTIYWNPYTIGIQPLAFSSRPRSGQLCADHHTCCTHLAGNPPFPPVYPSSTVYKHPAAECYFCRYTFEMQATFAIAEVEQGTTTVFAEGDSPTKTCPPAQSPTLLWLPDPPPGSRSCRIQRSPPPEQTQTGGLSAQGKVMLEVCLLNINFLLKINRIKWSSWASRHQDSYFADTRVARRSGMRRAGCSISAGWWAQGPRAGQERQRGALPPGQKLKGKVEPPKEITVVKTPVSSHWRSSLLGAGSDPHPSHVCPFPAARINPLANEHPTNTQSLHNPSLTFSPY